MKIILLLIIMFYIVNINQNNYHISINRLIRMYKSSIDCVSVFIIAGLGNRLMSAANIIVLSIFYKSKPKSIYKSNIIYSN